MTPEDAWRREQSARLAEVRRVFARHLAIALAVVVGLGLLVTFVAAVVS